MGHVESSLTSSSSLLNLGKWKCKSSSVTMIEKLETKQEIFKNPKLPRVECDNVIIPDSGHLLPAEEFFHVEDYPTIAFPETNDFKLVDICQSFKTIEEADNFTCTDLCDKSQLDRSNLFDFINYCKYCGHARGYESFNERIGDNNCKNSNVSIRGMVEKFPTDARFCGFTNLGLPFIVPYLDYSYICYCVSSNTYGMGCKKRALPSFTTDFTAYLGITSFSILSLAILFSLLIPKIINLLQKDRDRNQYSVMRLLPSAAIFFASLLRVVAFIAEVNFLITPFRYLSTISEFVNYFSLIPILVYLYGVMKYVKTQRRPNAILSYCLVISVFLILIICCIVITIILQFTVGPVYMIVGWISVSWLVEFFIHAACFFFLVVIYITLKRTTDIATTSTKVS